MPGTDAPDQDRTDALAAAGMALGRAAWADAQERYELVLAQEEVAEALEGLAIARWWQDDVDAAIHARERAYVLRREQDDAMAAARVAAFLAWDYGAMRGSSAVANGWLRRAQRLAADAPPSAEHAWLLLIEASFHIDTDASEVLRLASAAAEHAHTYGGLDVEMTARTLQGLALVSLGQVEDGTRLLDEGTAAATAGELYDPIAIGSCCCNMIIACERARDFDRAGEWCEQLSAYSERTGQRPLLALCRAHHGTVLTARGEWPAAEEKLAWAADALTKVRPPLAGFARARLAQLRLRQGRPADARALLSDANDHVLVPLVQAEIALEEGDPSAALGYAQRYLRSLGADQPIQAADALELLVPINVGLGEIERANEAYASLAAIAEAVATDPVRAAERGAAAALALGQRDAGAASRALEDAVGLHRRSGAPFHEARARVALARVLAEDRPERALEHAVAAATAFEDLGAPRAAREAARLVVRLGGRSEAARRAGMTRREVEVLSLVAEGMSNREIALRLVVSEHTVHRHLANVYARLGVSSRAAAVALASERGLLA